jgi:hypothetical protein
MPQFISDYSEPKAVTKNNMKHEEIEKELIFARKLVKLLLNVFYEEVDAHAQVQTYFATVDGGYLEKYLEIIKETK